MISLPWLQEQADWVYSAGRQRCVCLWGLFTEKENEGVFWNVDSNRHIVLRGGYREIERQK